MNLRVTVITLYVDDLERALRGSPRACGDRDKTGVGGPVSDGSPPRLRG